MHHGPEVRRRKLGAELRALRTAAGLTSGEAARRAGWHQSKVSRIETGTSGVKPADVRLLLDAYEVEDGQLRELLLALAGSGDAEDRPWWHAYRGVLPPTYRDFISLESQATGMRTLETSVVPGLLQTPEYARAVTRAAVDGVDEQRLDTLVEVRLTRQGVLRGDPPLRLNAVLDEAVLRRQVGGPEVMARQLDRLMEAARLPQVTLQVLPFSAGAHIGVTGPFVIFSFSNTSDLDVVVLDHLTSSLHLERKEDLQAYSEAFDTLRLHAMPAEDSLEYIAEIRQDW
ncbi:MULTISPECIES: helix-turn-helix domain-containing protein [Streptomyces]|jgi:transcriptional regulator with XRE-family HTH domain|uniref:Helix-turn-helix domain-containing protein n=1 Tax=Streptomyces thermoviolaceus subsp. thermoviolaceus TaxID=66860 RepID=A0ABX0YUU2_STRTL|nr:MULTISPECIES: helix-turn-helix transcriptional regulator [Streptomyces]MCM3262762.1 helix-turn-helix domain-containing protein [Streptomyces thermoviolaceus]NJP14810.1 helix-turn-helix domain-containing protein [Streptomyces thermoviolaceus subsp. thermoviolaceus]RSS01255.1 XRE family transcriptional regulator [Streptomyces sp. WAC00469]WTD50187.1 helix-turn-helix domain-containing protein [Streptomyces thermoviolaceus]GGV64685.1 transcriptional regulator [Streptomyces thermoviolaceus subsp